MSLRIVLEGAAESDLAELPRALQRRTFERIVALGEEPRPTSSKELAGQLRGLRSMRVGDYRVAYQIDEAAGLIVVQAIGHRSRFYDRISRRLA